MNVRTEERQKTDYWMTVSIMELSIHHGFQIIWRERSLLGKNSPRCPPIHAFKTVQGSPTFLPLLSQTTFFSSPYTTWFRQNSKGTWLEREAWLERIVSKKAGEIMPPSPLFSHPWHRKEIVKTVCMYVQRKWLLFYSSFTNPCIKKSPYYQYTNSHSAVVLFLSVCVCVPSTPYSFPTDFRVVYYILTTQYTETKKCRWNLHDIIIFVRWEW